MANKQSVARLRGLQEDLKLSDTQYSTCLSILYVTYILGQVPSNIILNRVSRPSIYIGVVMLLWGAISCCSGATTNFVSIHTQKSAGSGDRAAWDRSRFRDMAGSG